MTVVAVAYRQSERLSVAICAIACHGRRPDVCRRVAAGDYACYMRRIAEPKRRNVIRMAGLDLTGAWLIVRCRLVAKGC
jgi:hypothetical protein